MSPSASVICAASPVDVACRVVMFPSASDILADRPAAVMDSCVIRSSSSSR